MSAEDRQNQDGEALLWELFMTSPEGLESAEKIRAFVAFKEALRGDKQAATRGELVNGLDALFEFVLDRLAEVNRRQASQLSTVESQRRLLAGPSAGSKSAGHLSATVLRGESGGSGRILGSGVSFLRAGEGICLGSAPRWEAMFLLAPSARIVSAASEAPYRLNEREVCGRRSLALAIVEVPGTGEVYARQSLFRDQHSEGPDVEIVLEFSYATVGGTMESPLRCYWSIIEVLH